MQLAFTLHRLSLGVIFCLVSIQTAYCQINPANPPKVDPAPKPNGPIPKPTPLAVNCFLSTKKPRPFPCEFGVAQIRLANVKEPGVLNPLWDSKPLVLSLSKAVTVKEQFHEGDKKNYLVCLYQVVLTVRRVAKPSQSVPTYVFTYALKPSQAATTFLSDSPFAVPSAPSKPALWQAYSEPALAMSVNKTEELLLNLTVLIDPAKSSGGPYLITKAFSSPVEKSKTMDLRLYIHNMVTTWALKKIPNFPLEARDYAEWAGRVNLTIEP